MERTGKRQAKDGRRRRKGKKNSKTGPLQLKSCAWPNNTEQKEPFPVSSRWSITWRRGSLRKPLLPLFHTHTHKNHPSREISNVVGGCELEIQMFRAPSLILIFCFVLLWYPRSVPLRSAFLHLKKIPLTTYNPKTVIVNKHTLLLLLSSSSTCVMDIPLFSFPSLLVEAEEEGLKCRSVNSE